MSHSNNALLARLDDQALEQISVHLKTVDLRRGQVLVDTHQHIQQAYFPHSGIISCVVVLNNGSIILTGMIGRDGQFGAGQALDHKLSLNRVIVQVAGTASVINDDRLREAAEERPALRKLLIGYEEAFLAQVQQTAACNASHDIQSRSCKWLLRMHDLAGVDLPLTQDFLAEMMGVRRTSVSAIATELQRAGLISYRRGHLHIEDDAKIRQRACECYDAYRSHYRAIFRAAEGVA
jgi:CRP-like cAMP-binding protein